MPHPTRDRFVCILGITGRSWLTSDGGDSTAIAAVSTAIAAVSTALVPAVSTAFVVSTAIAPDVRP